MAPTMSKLRAQRFDPGDVILEAKPMVHVVYVSLKSKHCDNCLMRRSSLKRCAKCYQMYYCDKNCQQIDWKYHKHECRYMSRYRPQYLRATDNELLLFRLWLCLRSNPTFGTKKYKQLDGSQICFNDIEVNTKELLKPYSENISINKELDSMAMHFSMSGIEYSFMDCVEEMLRLLVIIRGPLRQAFDWCSSDTNELDFIKNVGHGIFPQLMSVQHSCLPNSAVVTRGMCSMLA